MCANITMGSPEIEQMAPAHAAMIRPLLHGLRFGGEQDRKGTTKRGMDAQAAQRKQRAFDDLVAQRG